MGHAPPVDRVDTTSGADVDGVHFYYDKLTDSTVIVGETIMDAHSGSNFLMTAVTGHNLRPTVAVVPSYRIEGKKRQPTTAPDSITIAVTAMLARGTGHAAARMDAKAPDSAQLVLLLDDSVRTRIPLKLLDADHYSSYYGGSEQGTGLVTYTAVVPLSFLVRWTQAKKVEGRFPSGDFSFHGKDAHKWQAFVDYVSGVPGVASTP